MDKLNLFDIAKQTGKIKLHIKQKSEFYENENIAINFLLNQKNENVEPI